MTTPEIPPTEVPPPTTAAAPPLRPVGPMTAALAIVAALAAGAISWGAGEVNRNAFDPVLTLELSLSNSMYGLSNRAAARAAALLYGTLAGLTGLFMGVAGGLARGNVRRGTLAGVVGLVVGAGAAVGVALVLVPYFKTNYNPDTNDLILPMLVHGGIWSATGLAGGLAFGLGLGPARQALRTVVGGVAGALVATAAYEFIGAFAFATQKTVDPVAEGVGARGLAFLAVSIGVGFMVAASLRERPAKSTA